MVTVQTCMEWKQKTKQKLKQKIKSKIIKKQKQKWEMRVLCLELANGYLSTLTLVLWKWLKQGLSVEFVINNKI